MKQLLFKLFGGFKGFLFIIVVGIGLFLHVYTQRVITQLREESRSLVQFYAGLYSQVVESEAEDLSFLFDQVIRKTTFPLIQTDSEHRPISWKGIDVDPEDRSEEALERVDVMLRRMARSVEPVPIMYGEVVLNYLYYGDSRFIQQMRWLPTIEIGIVGLFIIVGFIGYANLKRSEQRYVWVGMAKETAHQLGTPISSLMGWLELMRSGKENKKENIYDEMEKDLTRLERVSTRFSQIGSKPDLKETHPEVVLSEVAAYIRRRAPQMNRRVTISENYTEVPTVPMNAGLFQWAVENVMKNSLDAMDKDKGTIVVRLDSLAPDRVYVEIEDNGKGIDPKDWKRVFEPGHSTKKRGWGLGLTLSKRIVEEYHGGKLFIKESRPGQGTVMRIEI